MKQSIDRELKLFTGHKTLMLLHGPDANVDDGYATISSAPANWSFLARTSFGNNDGPVSSAAMKLTGKLYCRTRIRTRDDRGSWSLHRPCTGAREIRSSESRSGAAICGLQLSGTRTSPAHCEDRLTGQAYVDGYRTHRNKERISHSPKWPSTPPMFPDFARGDSVPITPSNYGTRRTGRRALKISTSHVSPMNTNSISEQLRISFPFGSGR